jgi:hypothetical protein
VWKEGRIIGPQEAKGSRPDWVQRWAAAGGGEQGEQGEAARGLLTAKQPAVFIGLERILRQ